MYVPLVSADLHTQLSKLIVLAICSRHFLPVIYAGVIDLLLQSSQQALPTSLPSDHSISNGIIIRTSPLRWLLMAMASLPSPIHGPTRM